MDRLYTIITILLCVIPLAIGGTNSLYLWHTSRYRSVPKSKKSARWRHNQNKNKPTRCCHISNGIMWSYIGLYYLILASTGLVVNIIYGDLVSTVATTSLVVMVLLIVIILGKERVSSDDRVNPGILKTATLLHILGFACCCFFWSSVAFSITCTQVDCSDLKPYVGFIVMGVSYPLMLIEACVSCFDVVFLHKISQSEAFERMKNKMEEEPKIRWEAECGHYKAIKIADRTYSSYVMLHKETLSYPADQYSSIKIKTPSGPLDKATFQSEYTKLLLRVSTHPGDNEVQEDIIQRGKAFKDSHKGHDEELNFRTQNHFLYRYIVTDNDNPPTWLNWKWYTLFAFLGLSPPYRIFLYCKLGHAKFDIEKYVYSGNYTPLPPVSPRVEVSTIEMPE